MTEAEWRHQELPDSELGDSLVGRMIAARRDDEPTEPEDDE